jgi:hypothetical protein
MALNFHKGYPDRMLEDSYVAKVGEAIDLGMMVIIDSASGQLVKAVGGADEYAMVAFTKQPLNFMENGGKVSVVKENVSLFTSYFKVGPNYVPGCKLQVSTNAGEKGVLTIHAGGGAPVIGRYQRIEKMNNMTTDMMLFDLVRS